MNTLLAHRHGNTANGQSSCCRRNSGRIQIPAVMAVAAVLAILAGGGIFMKQDVIRSLLGPPAVGMTESYTHLPGGPSFDHSTFDQLLKKHVSDQGWVDYQGMKRDHESLDAYITSIANAPIEKMGRNERLALLINAYNAFTLRLVLDHDPVHSIKDIPGHKRWDARRWNIGSHTLSLNEIEHQQIRSHFQEPRIHFALVCAAVGCPPLANTAYTADQLETQLDRQAQFVHNHDRWFRFDPDDPTVVHLTKLYKWYRGDFEQTAESVLNFAARYSPTLKQTLAAGSQPKIQWLKYDWALNRRDKAP